VNGTLNAFACGNVAVLSAGPLAERPSNSFHLQSRRGAPGKDVMCGILAPGVLVLERGFPEQFSFRRASGSETFRRFLPRASSSNAAVGSSCWRSALFALHALA